MWVLIICIGLLVLLLGFFLFTKNYQKKFIEQLDKKEHTFYLFYPMALFLVLETPLGEYVKELDEEREVLGQLYLQEDKETMQILYWCRKISIAVLAITTCLLLSLFATLNPTENKVLSGAYSVQREATGEGSKSVSVKVHGEDREEQELLIEVPEQRYTEQEAKEKIEEAKNYVTKVYLGENESASNIEKNLNLVKSMPENAVAISWSSWREEIVTSEGKVCNAALKEKTEGRITAYISYGEQEEKIDFSISVVPAKEISDAEWKEELTKEIEQAAGEDPTETQMNLPEEILGKKVSYGEIISNNGPVFLGLGAVAVIAIWFGMGSDLKKKAAKRDREMMLDYPELVNKFTLLLSAGMTVGGAWEKIALEYEKKKKMRNGKKRYAYEEWCMTYYEMQNGVTEARALEHFGQRCKLMPYLKFATLLGQNLRKGSKGLLAMLEYEALDAFEERKQNTKRLAEEAGTKLLAPMMLMLALVMVILMVPAVMSM